MNSSLCENKSIINCCNAFLLDRSIKFSYNIAFLVFITILITLILSNLQRKKIKIVLSFEFRKFSILFEENIYENALIVCKYLIISSFSAKLQSASNSDKATAISGL